jgi:glycosyltransferase involved in cell wall biosynthesis
LIFADEGTSADLASVDRPRTTLFNFPERGFVEQAAAATADKAPRAEGPPTVLYLGGMERNRGARLMVDAFAQVHAAMPEARLLVVGHFAPPELEDEVRARAAELDVAVAITLTGRVPFEEIGRYLRQVDVGWVTWQPVPKNEKNIPTKLFEYMAYALPVVAGALPSTRAFVREGETGYLVTADDPAAHACAILDLFRHPGAAAAMGRRGQALVRSAYNWDEMERRLLALYEELLS